jgi:hypothetical protein
LLISSASTPEAAGVALVEALARRSGEAGALGLGAFGG